MNAIVTCASSMPEWFDRIVLPRMKDYAARCHAELHVVTPTMWRGVISRGEMIAPVVREHDRTLVLDADIVISREAPNIFDAFPAGRIYAIRDSLPSDEHCLNRIADVVALQAIWGSCEGRWTDGYYNAGVVLCDRRHDLIWSGWRDCLPQMWPDQANLNYQAHKFYGRIEPISAAWNGFAMACGYLHPQSGALLAMSQCHIAHVAGFEDRESAIVHLDRVMP